MHRHTKILIFICVLLGLLVIANFVFPDVLDSILTYLEGVDSSSPSTAVVFWCLLWATVQPVMIGYSLILIAIGFVYGWWGILLAYTGSCTGGWITFILTRALCRYYNIAFTYIAHLSYLARYKMHILALEENIDERGLRIAMLLQLSFAPYGFLNSILSTTRLRFIDHFIPATLVSRVKVIPYVWLGTNGRDLAELWRGNRLTSGEPQDIIIMVVGSTFALVSLIVLSYYANRELRRMPVVSTDGDGDGDASGDNDMLSGVFCRVVVDGDLHRTVILPNVDNETTFAEMKRIAKDVVAASADDDSDMKFIAGGSDITHMPDDTPVGSIDWHTLTIINTQLHK